MTVTTTTARLTEALQKVSSYVNASEDIASWDADEINALLLGAQLIVDEDLRGLQDDVERLRTEVYEAHYVANNGDRCYCESCSFVNDQDEIAE